MSFIRNVGAGFLCLAISLEVCAQSAQVGINIHDHLLIRQAERVLSGNAATVHEGTPYFNEDFKQTKVSTESAKFIPVLMRYNIAEDAMEFAVGGLKYLLDPDPQIARIEMGDDVFVVGKGQKNGFYQLKLDGQVSVVTRLVVNFRPQNDITGVTARYSRQADAYYVMLPDRVVRKVTSLRNLIDFLPDHQDEVARFAKSEKVGVKTEDDLFKLVGYYNSLVQP